jgi:exodeoxyribonuclease VII large subunit
VEPGTFTVRQLTAGIQEALGAWFPGEIWVQGEIATLTRSPAGHVYFQLIEAGPPGSPPEASIAVTLFASAKAYVNTVLRQAGGVRMADGMQIRIRGRVELYGPQGRIQIRMSGIDPAYTLGLLATDRQRLIELLADEGLLDRNRTTTMPVGPLHVGLVTSNGSAAMADFLHELEGSGFRWRISFCDTRVQGVGADTAVAEALRVVARRSVDVIALVRGGGARTDMMAFDSEVVARTIAGLPIPVTTGIGHETDQSVADAVAHTASKTPTACAAELVSRVRDSLDRAQMAWRAIEVRARSTATRQDHLIDSRAAAVSRLARSCLDDSDARLRACERRAALAARATLDRSELRLARDEARVASVDPDRALARGWSITRSASGSAVRRAAELSVGDELTTQFVDGSVRSVVSTTWPDITDDRTTAQPVGRETGPSDPT